LVVVAIIGILAAVVIPAYKKYQRNPKQTVLKVSINTIIGSFETCLNLNSFRDCADDNIKGTLREKQGTTVKRTPDATPPNKVCYRVEAEDDELNACVHFKNESILLRNQSQYMAPLWEQNSVTLKLYVQQEQN